MKYSIFYTILFINFFNISYAQSELGLHFMDTLWQSNFTNPAFHAISNKTVAMLPSAYGSLALPFSATQVTSNENGKNVINFKSIFNATEPINAINAQAELQTIGLSIGFTKLNLSFYHKFKTEISGNISKDLIGGFAYGNRAYLGKVMDLSSGINAQAYSEIGLGAAYEINDKISIGARVKKMAGFASITTLKQKLALLTDSSDYKLTFNTDFEAHTYDMDRLEKFSNGTMTFTELLRSDNTGYSFDLGATVKLKKLRLAASIIDLGGAIKWQHGAKVYSSRGTYTYTGEKSDNFLSFKGFNDSTTIDTLKAALNVQEYSKGSARISLPTKIYISALYELNAKIKLGALLYQESWNDLSRTDIMLSSTFRLAQSIHLGLTYAMKNSTYDNVGVNFVFNLSSLQFYGMTDNILSLIKSENAKNTHFRVGLNLSFNN